MLNNNWTATTIINFLADHAEELRVMGVVRIGLFGSYARGEQQAASDIDFVVRLDGWTWKRWCQIWSFLERHFGTEIDLIPEEDIRPELKNYIFQDVRYVQIA